MMDQMDHKINSLFVIVVVIGNTNESLVVAIATVLLVKFKWIMQLPKADVDKCNCTRKSL